MAKIHILDEHIANQIAAGEVVERPASVVKELVENSIDAGSTHIVVTVEEGGLQSIRVTDNGSGIDSEDCETAFYRHATSKITQGRDLYHITSLGFRGEALPSIASVSKVELTTSSSDDGLGHRLIIEGGKLLVNETTAAQRGTDFLVKELFYNTPARLKYMKTIQTELGHISDYMYRIALSHPEIGITLRHNGNTLLQTVGNGDLQQVIAAIYGTQAAKAMLQLEAEDLDFRVSGYVSRPDFTRSNRNGISLIVNGRYIRNYGLNQAILRAYHTLLPVNRYPLAVLSLTMHPSLVDVNVHPSKLEVRFSKEEKLFPFVQEAIHAVLKQQVLIPEPVKSNLSANGKSFIQEQFHFSKGGAAKDVSVQPSSAASELRELERYTPPANRSAASDSSDLASGEIVPEASRLTGPRDRDTRSLTTEQTNWNTGKREAGYTSANSIRENNRTPYTGQQDYSATRRPQSGTAGITQELLTLANGSQAEIPDFPEMTLIGQHHGTYLIAQSEQGLYLIDQHAAHERINYEYYYEKFGSPADASQELLIPFTLEFTPSETEQLKDRLHWFEQAGVILEHFGGQTFIVRSHPYWFPKGEEQDIVEEMAEWVLGERVIDLAKLREKSSILCSCKASIKANQSLAEMEAVTLTERLGTCKQPYTCPHGRPIVVSFTTYDLEKMFKRVM